MPGEAAESAGSEVVTTEPAAGVAGADAKAGAAPEGTKTPEPVSEFEFELEELGDPGEDGKPTIKKVPTKIPLAEAKQRLANLQKLEGGTKAHRAKLEEYYEKQIKPLEQRIEEARRDPTKLADLARHFGVDFDKALEAHARREVELANMTPEQRELHATKAELARLKAADEARQKDLETQQQQQRTLQISAKIQEHIAAAATEFGLPKDPAVLMTMTHFLRTAVNKGIMPDVKAAAEYARNLHVGGLRASAKGLTYEQIEKEFPELLTVVREGDIRKVKGAAGSPPGPSRVAPKPKKQVQTFISPEEYRDQLLKGE